MSMKKALKSLPPRKLPRTPPAKPSKAAVIYAFRQFVYVASQATYRSSHPDPKGVEFFLPTESSNQELGENAHAALAASRFLRPDHPEFDEVMRFPTKEEEKAYDEKLLRAAGVKTLRTLYIGAKRVSMRIQDSAISIKSWKHRGGGAWEGIRGLEPAMARETVGDIELGQAIRAALAKSF